MKLKIRQLSFKFRALITKYQSLILTGDKISGRKLTLIIAYHIIYNGAVGKTDCVRHLWNLVLYIKGCVNLPCESPVWRAWNSRCTCPPLQNIREKGNKYLCDAYEGDTHSHQAPSAFRQPSSASSFFAQKALLGRVERKSNTRKGKKPLLGF